MVQLVVAEKPSVARDIARVLGVAGRGQGCLQSARVWITWCVGHVAQLAEPEAYNPAWKTWSAASLPMLPEQFTLRPSDHARDQWQHIQRLMRDGQVQEVVNACDAGREGELIFRFAYELSGCSKPVRRLWLSALTDGAVRAGFENLKPGSAFDALGAAARCRAEADWLVGMNATRALTLRQRRLTPRDGAQRGKGPLFSVGRVQTPTLAMLVHREQAITTFVPEPFWQVLSTFDTAAGTYEGLYHAGKIDRLKQKEAAEAVAAEAQGPARVGQVEHRDQMEPPPLLFDLTSLQRLANVRYHLSAAATLEAAQSLYERHKLLTYPRTDSNHLTQDMAPGLPATLRGLSTPPYGEFVAALPLGKLPLGPRIINDKEVGDHHAIIPTGKTPNLAALNTAERQIFDLVARRFIAAFYPAARFALTRIETHVGHHLFVTRGRVRLVEGWQKVEVPLGAGPGSKEPPLLPNVKTGDAATVASVRIRPGETKPPPRYNDALLLGAMERAGSQCETAELRLAMKDGGLGTPATRASIIEILQKRGYARRDGRLLVPTAQGEALIGALPVAELKSAELTGAWEARLAKVAKAEMSRGEFMREVSTLTGDVVRAILGDMPRDPVRPPPAHRPKPVAARPPAKTLPTCPLCSQAPLMRGKAAWGCSAWRQGCGFVLAFAPLGHALSEASLKKLIERGATAPFDATAPGAQGRVKLQLDLTAEARVRAVAVRARRGAAKG